MVLRHGLQKPPSKARHLRGLRRPSGGGGRPRPGPRRGDAWTRHLTSSTATSRGTGRPAWSSRWPSG